MSESTPGALVPEAGDRPVISTAVGSFTESLVQGAPDKVAPPVNLWTVLAPWRFLFRPVQAGRRMMETTNRGLALTGIVGILSVSGLILCLQFLHSSVVDLSDPEVAKVRLVFGGAHFGVQSPGEVIHRWRTTGELESMIPRLVTLPTLILGIGLALSWLQIPLIWPLPDGGSGLGTSVKMVVSSLGVVFLLAGVVGGALIWRVVLGCGPMAENRHWLELRTLLGVGVVAGSILVLLSWLRRSVRGAVVRSTLCSIGHACESCGYDLTHRPERGRCPECGESIEQSLERGQRRTLGGFMSFGGKSGWWPTTRRIFLDGHRFYARWTARESADRVWTFSSLHFLTIAVSTALWVTSVMFTQGNQSSVDIASIGGIIVEMAVIAGWLTHLGVGAVVVTLWWWRGWTVPEGVSAKVFLYETAWLWVFCLWNGTMLTTFFVFDDWISNSFGGAVRGLTFGLPAGPAVLLLGNAALILVWIRRWHGALKAVRWANY